MTNKAGAEKMKAIALYKYLKAEDPDSLIDVEVAKPVPEGRDLLVRVKAISVNPVDTKVRAPKDKVEESPKILGWDVAGVIEQVGENCELFRPGDEVYYAGSLTRPGGNSEFHLVDERITGKKPSSLDFAQAAALPLTAITAWEGLFDRLGLNRGKDSNAGATILIVGAAGGVGSIAVQLAKYAGLTVIGTASRPESAEWAKRHGADYIVDHSRDFGPQLNELGFKDVDYIFCLNSTEQHWRSMADAIAPQGKICTIVETKQPVDLSPLKNKSAAFVWEFMFTRPMFQTADMIEQHKLLGEISALVDAGTIRTTLAERLSPIDAANLRKAHAMLEKGRTIGKIVLERFD